MKRWSVTLQRLFVAAALLGCDDDGGGEDLTRDAEAPPGCALDCGAGGQCVEEGGAARCDCGAGFAPSGGTCVPVTGACAGVDCGAGGQCVEEGGAARCDCAEGFRVDGLSCAPAASPCVGVDCGAGGQCVEAAGAARCECGEGFVPTGLSCVPAVSPCAGVDCGGHGQCVEEGDTPRCLCAADYIAEGLTCVPAPAPCEGVDCGGHGQCVEVGDSARCDCAEGYTSSGLDCVPESSPCVGVDCSGLGVCVEVQGAPTCQCDEGHQAAGLTCVPLIDPCEEVSCSNHGACVITEGEPRCECEAGFEPQGLACVDALDPCEGVTCSGHGACAAGETGLECVCVPGYVADGLSCVEEGEDPCVEGGLGLYGACDGATLLFCDREGQLLTNDCAGLGLACGLIDTDWGYDCVLGRGQECDPTHGGGASLCDPTQDLRCVNNACVANPGFGCAQIGFAGACAEGTLYWCDNNGMRSRACPEETACAHLNEAWGYDCLLGQGAACDPASAEGASLCETSEQALVCLDGTCQMPAGCEDGDGDGYGVGDGCLGPDCDDEDAAVYADCRPDCADSDGDGYGIGPECLGEDCDDNDANLHEGCPIDCVDADGDGYGFGTECHGEDCDDNDASIHEGCPPPCVDNDNDGYGVGAGCAGPDCDDNNINLNVDCSLDCFDPDGDGYGVGEDCLGADCDPEDPALHSGCAEGCDPAHNDGDEWEPDECANLAVELVDGQVSGHSISPIGDVDWYWFDVDQVAFDLSLHLTTPEGVDHRPSPSLYIDGGALSIGYDSYERPSNNTIIKHYRNLHKGRYWVKVADSNRRLHGTYALHINTTDLGAVEDSGELDPNRDNAVTLASGVPVQRSLWPLGEEDWFVLELSAAANDLICEISVPEGAVDRPTYQVYHEGSADALNIDESDYNDTRAEWTYRNLPPGTYYVRVEDRDSRDATRMHGAYTFQCSIIDLGTLEDAYEEDNTRETATALAADTVQHHALAPIGDVDFMRFELTAAASDLSVRIEVPDSAVDRPTFDVFRDEDEQKLDLDGYDNPTNYRVAHFKNLPAGFYYIKVKDWINSDSARAHGNYTIQWSSVNLNTQEEINEPNDTRDQASEFTNMIYEGSIDPINDVDFIRFEIENQASDLYMKVEMPEGARYRPTYEIYPEGSETRVVYDQVHNPADFREVWFRNIPRGVYYARVVDYTDHHTLRTHGSYTLSYALTDLGAPLEEGEPNDQIQQATPLQVDTTTQHAIAPIGDMDIFAITLEQAGNLRIEVSVPETGVDCPDFRVSDGAHSLDWNTRDSQRLRKSLGYQNLPPGTYYLHVYDYGMNRAYGTYSVNWTQPE